MLLDVFDIHIRVFVLDLGHQEAGHRTEDGDTGQNPGNHDGLGSKEVDRRIGLERFQID